MGILGSILLGVLIKKYRYYRKFLIFSGIASLGLFGSMLFALNSE